MKQKSQVPKGPLSPLRSFDAAVEGSLFFFFHGID